MAGHHQVDLLTSSPQLAGGKDQLASGLLSSLVSLWILKCSATADCTIDLRCCLDLL